MQEMCHNSDHRSTIINAEKGGDNKYELNEIRIKTKGKILNGFYVCIRDIVWAMHRASRDNYE